VNFNKFKEMLNEEIFEKFKIGLLGKRSDNLEGYEGLFRSIKSWVKILQNLLQSQEIKFVDAFEKLIKAYLIERFCYSSKEIFR
jgi:hypothetical protein